MPKEVFSDGSAARIAGLTARLSAAVVRAEAAADRADAAAERAERAEREAHIAADLTADAAVAANDEATPGQKRLLWQAQGDRDAVG